MGRLNIGSWFSTRRDCERAKDDLERRKQARRDFSSLSSALPLKSNIDGNGNEKDGGIKCKVDRHPASTMRSDSDMANGAVEIPASGTSGMVALSKKIAEETERLEKYMKANGLAMPAFDVDAADDFPKLPEEIQKSRLQIIHATKELRDLAVGPRECVRWGVWDVSSKLSTTTNISMDVCNLMLINS